MYIFYCKFYESIYYNSFTLQISDDLAEKQSLIYNLRH